MISAIGTSPLAGAPDAASCCRTSGSAANDAGSGVTAYAANLHDDASAQLRIVTRGGDTVTLSAEQVTDLTRAAARDGARGASARYASLSLERSLTLQVSGNLSAAETKDVRSAVRAFLRSLRAFFSGRSQLGPGRSDVAQGNGHAPTTLASVSASFSDQRTLTLVAASLGSPAPASRPDVAPVPVAPVPGEPA